MKYLAKLIQLFQKIYDRMLMFIMLILFKKHGRKNVFFPTKSFFSYSTIQLGDEVYIGPGATFSSITEITIDKSDV